MLIYLCYLFQIYWRSMRFSLFENSITWAFKTAFQQFTIPLHFYWKTSLQCILRLICYTLVDYLICAHSAQSFPTAPSSTTRSSESHNCSSLCIWSSFLTSSHCRISFYANNNARTTALRRRNKRRAPAGAHYNLHAFSPFMGYQIMSSARVCMCRVSR